MSNTPSQNPADADSTSFMANPELIAQLSALKLSAKEKEVAISVMSSIGKDILEDTERLVDDTAVAIESKNRGEHLQKAIAHAQKASELASDKTVPVSSGKGASLAISSEEKEKIKEKAAKGALSMMVLAKLLVTSNEFRKLLADLFGIAHDILQKGSEEISEATKDVTEIAKNATEVVEDVASKDEEKPAEPPKDLADRATNEDTDSKNRVESSNDDDNIKADVQYLKEKSKEAIEETKKAGELGKEKVDQVTTQLKQAYEKREPQIADMVPEFTKLSDDQVDILCNRFTLIMQELQSKPEYQRSTDFIIDQLRSLPALRQIGQEHLSGAIKHEEGKKESKHAMIETEFVLALMEIKEFLQQWLDTSLDPLISSFNSLYTAIIEDRQAVDSCNQAADFLRACLQDLEYIQDYQRVRSDSRKVVNNLREALWHKYRQKTKQLTHEARHIGGLLLHDETTQLIGDDVNALLHDMFMDTSGKPVFKPELVSDLCVILPLVLKKLTAIPLPPITIHQETCIFKARGITVNIKELLPTNMSILLSSKLRNINFEDTVGADLENNVAFELAEVRAECKNIRFVFEHLTFPKITEKGRLDFGISGKGMSLRLVLNVSRNSSNPMRIVKASCKIDKLHLRLHETGHDVLYWLLTPLVKGVIRRDIEKGIEDALRDAIVKVEAQVANITGAPQTPVHRKLVQAS